MKSRDEIKAALIKRRDDLADSWIENSETYEQTAFRKGHGALMPLLLDAIEAARLGLSFAPKGPVPKDLAPMFYHTLSYADEVKLQDRIDKAREFLEKFEKELGL